MKVLPIRDIRLKLLLLSLMHLATDALCAYLAFARLYPENPKLSFAVFIGYNFLAFVAQSPLGILIDRKGNRTAFFAVSTTAMVLGYLFYAYCLVAVFFIGVGNALFHVAGGKYVTDKSGNDVSHLGIFVSTGAVGLALGRRFLTIGGLVPLLFALLISCTLIMVFSAEPENKKRREEYVGKAEKMAWALLAVLFVVFARAFVCKVVTLDFETTQLLFLVIAVATALGKAMGGILARRIGALPVVIASMGVATICLTLGSALSYTYILGVFAFNFSMPITLYYANIIAKGNEGVAFGTLAAILAPGYLIGMLFQYSVGMKILVGVLCFISVFVIAIISKRIKNADRSVAFDDLD